METKKIMATFAILMIALGVAGFAYAHWSETLYLNGTVNTGNVAVTWSFNAILPPENTKPNYGPVATLNYTIYDSNNDGVNDTLSVTLNNAYPCLWVNGTIDVTNVGTIPVGIHDYNYTINDPNGVARGIEMKPWPKAYLVAPNGTEYPIILETWIKEVNQLDPGWSIKCTFNVHFGESTPENATATLTAHIEFWNWNELPRLR